MPDNDTKAIFLSALELPAPEREPFIVRSCAGNDARRLAVEELLRSHEESGTFMHEPPDRESGSPGSLSPVYDSRADGPDAAGRIGHYLLVRRIGEGSFGDVYHAEQTEPIKRSVALKVLKRGADSKQVLARFEAERQTLSTLDHPNIARFIDAGATDDGRPFFVMELVRGAPITEHCDANRMTIRDRVELFLGACRGVQHAHDTGLVHRDIKPGNVLVELRDDRAMARVIDFGIARAAGGAALDAPDRTRHGQMLGTPAYMSPEQAIGTLDIDARTDVWSLGCLLHELLVGVTPIPRDELRRASLADVQRIIREREIPLVSRRVEELGDGVRTIARQRNVESARLAGLLRGELEWVIAKCLSRDPAGRYANAGALGDDLRRWLDGRTVQARPARVRGPIGVSRSVARRHGKSIARASIVLVPLAGLGAWLAGWIPGLPGFSEMMQRSVETYASGQRYGLPEGAWVNGMRVNRAGGVYALVGGGKTNTAARDYAMVGGGLYNTASGNYSSVGGGANNTAEGDQSTVAGGGTNRVIGHGSTISGGRGNVVNHVDATVSGGTKNRAEGYAVAVGGGNDNAALGRNATIAGGRSNTAHDMQTTIGGGAGNRVGLPDSDEASADGSTIAGGISNVAMWRQSAVGGGLRNTAHSNYSVVSGGADNTAGDGVWNTGEGTTVSGGRNNSATKAFATIGGGQDNSVIASHGTIAGGHKNSVRGEHATVPGGTLNFADGFGSFAAGTRAHAQHDGSFVWSDRAGEEIPTVVSSGINSMTARARGGFHFQTGLSTTVLLRPGEGAWSHLLTSKSRRNAERVDAPAILAGVAALDIQRFEYTEQEAGVAHIAPAAEQFHEVFGLGVGDAHVSAADLDGVALAAIQALLVRVQEQDARILELERRLAEIR